MMKTYAIIVAGGTGSRFGSSVPKQFLDLCGTPVLCHTLRAFRAVLPAENIVTVISRPMEGFWRDLCANVGLEPGRLAYGGDTRWQSVRNGLEALGDISGDATVLVHDGARPLVTPDFITAVAGALRATGADGVIPAIPLTDSLRHLADDGLHSVAVDRAFFRAVQTPQAFPAARLKQAFSLPYRPEFTDEASMMAAAGFTDICLVPGSERNLKITRPVDLVVARYFLSPDDK
ncbi:MAG: 2-C-methyl-D-erythritol 4-phosphate cytidylyltransferase [Muribaculaceae bacterium]|nr:2-C-methyl-D-erythritol 4-phosphate cytidylyltransferase [Muribaculaceae bacterium]